LRVRIISVQLKVTVSAGLSRVPTLLRWNILLTSLARVLLRFHYRAFGVKYSWLHLGFLVLDVLDVLVGSPIVYV